MAGNTLDTASHFPNQAEMIILIDIQLDSFFISFFFFFTLLPFVGQDPFSIQIYLRNTFLFRQNDGLTMQGKSEVNFG